VTQKIVNGRRKVAQLDKEGVIRGEGGKLIKRLASWLYQLGEPETCRDGRDAVPDEIE
jgi:hypothetical protein